MLRYVIPAVVAASACGDGGTRGSLLSASRLSVVERETTEPVYVAVDDISGFVVDAPPEVTITPLTDRPGFSMTPSCDAAPGADTEVMVEVHDAGGARRGTLVLAITDDRAAECLADITIWDEPCDDATCGEPCATTPPAPAPEQLAIPRGVARRICAYARALDSTRPLTGDRLAIEPWTSAFMGAPPTDVPIMTTTTATTIRASSWLVGPFDITYSADAGGLPVTRRVPLAIGDVGDVGLEVGAPIGEPRDLARTIVPLTTHHFAQTACSLSIPSLLSPVVQPFDALLYPGSAVVSGAGQQALACDDDPHATFALSVVPAIDAPKQVSVPLVVSGAGEAVDLAVTSRVDDLFPSAATTVCGASPTKVACADADGDGALDVVFGGGGKECIVGVSGWRHDPASFAAVGSRDVQELIVIGNDVYGIDGTVAGNLVKLARDINGWHWVDVALAKAGAGHDVIALSSGATTAVDYVVGSIGPMTLRFSRLDGAAAYDLALPATYSGVNVALGSIPRTSGAGDDVLLVGQYAGGNYPVALYGLDWSSGTPAWSPTSSDASLPATGPNDMPPDARRSVAFRDDGGNLKILIAFYAGPFANAVAELPRTLGTPTDAYGGVRSIAAVSDRTVLLGAATGAQRSSYDTVLSQIQYRTIDPAPQPSASYGNAIAPCVDKQGSFVGYIVSSGAAGGSSRGFRAALPDITRELP